MANVQHQTNYLTFEDGLVTVGDTELPGLVTSISISGEVKMDSAKSDGQSGKKKTPMGFEDTTINIDMELLTDDDDEETENPTTCYDKLEAINALFKGIGPKAAPKILTVTNRHLRARQVNQVIFSGLASKETNQDDIIIVALTFTEHNPPVTTAEKRVVGKTLDEQKKAADAKKAPASKPSEKVLVIDAR